MLLIEESLGSNVARVDSELLKAANEEVVRLRSELQVSNHEVVRISEENSKLRGTFIKFSLMRYLCVFIA